MNGDSRAVWIATWQAGCRRGSDSSRQVLKIDGLGCCLAKQLCLEAQPNRPGIVLSNHSCLSFVSIWTCLFFFEQRARALQLIEHTHPSTHGNKHQPHTTMHHSFIAVSHVDLSLTSIKNSVMEGTFAQTFVSV